MTTSAPTERSASAERFLAIAEEVLATEAAAIRGVIDQLDDSFVQAVETMRDCSGRIVCTGMGKSGHVMKKIAATLSSTGTPSFFLHPAEAIHGDLGMIVSGDVVLAASFSGGTEELLQMLDNLRSKQVPLIAVTGRNGSPLAKEATLHLSAAIDREACPHDLAPTASTTATLALCDALAMALLEARGFTAEQFAHLHPGGSLGRQLRRVEQLMHTGDDMPHVSQDAPLREAIVEMSKKSLGIAAVVDTNGKPVGALSDGDLRRLLEGAGSEGLLERSVRGCMTPNPRCVEGSELARAALRKMEEHRITSLFVCDPSGVLVGVVHIHDLWGQRRRG